MLNNNFESFDNSETATKKDIVIQERVELVSSHMYKQFLDYQHATVNTNEVFNRMIDCLDLVANNLNILWHKMSFTTRCNSHPQALHRKDGRHIFSNRIIALQGNYNELVKDAKNHDEEMEILLENEIASLYVPAEQTEKCVFKIKHTGQEFAINQIDAPREVVLKVIETVCGGGAFHKDGFAKTFVV